ncbi:hypothetical protein [Neptuniibacter sp.]|uniref:hypothetical protein n=1 Tax=Neptuniibacter sp. TaxID=1962643 RepID=UPI003B5958C7
MPNPENESIPYLKGMLTLSILMLIYVYGQADIKNTLTIALIGLEIKNPDILGQMIFIALTWYTIRFWRTGEENLAWNYEIETRSIIANALHKHPCHDDFIVRILNEFAPDDFPPEAEEGLYLTYGRSSSHRGAAVANFPHPYKARGTDSARVDVPFTFLMRIRLEFLGLTVWMFDRDNLSHHYLPFLLSIFSLMSVLTAAGYNPFSLLIAFL